MKVRKAIIPAAGLGTRLLPNTKSIPKEMLPLVDKPVLQYIVEEAVAAGVEQILIITNRGKASIEDYFDYAPDLEDRLLLDGKEKEAATIRAVADMADVLFLRQKETKGLGHAVWRAKSFVGNEPFAVLLGDDIMLGDKPVLKQLVEASEANGCSSVAIHEVPDELIVKYSSVLMSEKLSDRVWKITDMNEKPTLEEKFSNYAILGRYVLTPAIFDILANTAPGRNNEIQLTDGMKTLLRQEAMCGVDFEGRRYDTGNLKGYLEAIIDFALRNEEAGDWLKSFIMEKADLLRKT
ncbi:MAG: UTP--glucose-1-phosphate uridylyltransferase GalU [Oscillospiraceae bacterium]|nr:UTP--glucose-1-phosphate uridylyltransferase GalU [Oscillospiraceae bacterium]